MVARLGSPYALEGFSVATGEPLLVVDVSKHGDGVEANALEAARYNLGQLACTSVALCARPPSPAGAALRDRCDVVLESAEALDAVVAAVERTPLAALGLVQLLRHSEALDVHEGLIAESLVYSTLQAGPEFAAWLEGRAAPRRRRADPGPPVEVERDGDVLRLRLNRPGKRNAFSAEMRDALAEALQMAVCDPEARVELRGAGPSFCSGGDLDEFGTFPDPATAHAIRCTRNPGRLLARIAERASVHVHGACVGAGIELPAFAGHVAAAPDAFFQLPEVGMGLVPGAGGTVSIPRRIGRQRTAWLGLTGTRLDAATAHRWGLVDELEQEAA